jgi:hypothetical protein
VGLIAVLLGRAGLAGMAGPASTPVASATWRIASKTRLGRGEARRRLRQYTSTVGMEALVVQAQPAGDLPGDVAPQRADGFAVRQALQGLQHPHRGDHLGGYRRVPATLAGDVGEQLGSEQLVAVVGKEGVHRPVRDQVAAPAGRVHLGVGGMAWRAHEPGSLPALSSQCEPSDRPDQPDRQQDRTTPVQQAPRRPPRPRLRPRGRCTYSGADARRHSASARQPRRWTPARPTQPRR